MLVVALCAALFGGSNALSVIDPNNWEPSSTGSWSGIDSPNWGSSSTGSWSGIDYTTLVGPPEWDLDASEMLSMMAAVQKTEDKWDAIFGNMATMSIIVSATCRESCEKSKQDPYGRTEEEIARDRAEAEAHGRTLVKSWYSGVAESVFMKVADCAALAMDVAGHAYENYDTPEGREKIFRRVGKGKALIDAVYHKKGDECETISNGGKGSPWSCDVETAKAMGDAALGATKMLISWYCLQGMDLPDLQKGDPIELVKWGLEFGLRHMVPFAAVGKVGLAVINPMAGNMVADFAVKKVVKKVTDIVDDRRKALLDMVVQEETWENLLTALEDDGIKETLKAGIQRLKRSDLKPPEELPPLTLKPEDKVDLKEAAHFYIDPQFLTFSAALY